MSFFSRRHQSNVDIEHGPGTSLQPAQCSNWQRLTRLKTWLPGMLLNKQQPSQNDITRPSRKTMEDYRKGYPRFSALMAAHETFHILRRFSNARMRLLLHAQDRVVQLEERLDKIDNDETSPLFLSSRRRDKNYEREKTMKELHDALESLGA
ncbi:hypothetical protein FVER53263_20429 [Fusarium verticillioides]|nr:hypothetical protein FVER53263_20429 [Fusarium verticillioides]